MNLSIENQHRLKFWFHIIQVVLIFIAIIISIARLASKGTIPTRGFTWYLSVCFKSLIIILYQVLSEHHRRFQKWASAKANAILNVIETVFWLAAFIMVVKGNGGTCKGSSCALGSLLAALAFFLCLLTGFVAFVSVRDFRYLRKNGVLPGSAQPVKEYSQSGQV